VFNHPDGPVDRCPSWMSHHIIQTLQRSIPENLPSPKWTRSSCTHPPSSHQAGKSLAEIKADWSTN